MIWVSIDSDNGLLPVWRQAINWTNTGLLSIGSSLDHEERTSVRFESKYITFHSWKCFWKCNQRNGDHFFRRWVNKELTAHVRWTTAHDYLNHWQYDECNWTKNVHGTVLAGPIRLSLQVCLRGWTVALETHFTKLLWSRIIKILWEYELLLRET